MEWSGLLIQYDPQPCERRKDTDTQEEHYTAMHKTKMMKTQVKENQGLPATSEHTISREGSSSAGFGWSTSFPYFDFTLSVSRTNNEIISVILIYQRCVVFVAAARGNKNTHHVSNS